jgi:hypothetical protein
MLVSEKAAAYLSRDFVEPQLHLGPPFAGLLSRLICQVSVRLLRGIQCIAVWQGAALLETYRLSLAYLERGRSLLIFPEDPMLTGDEQCQMSPFRPGFARLGELYPESTRKCLRFVPAAVRTNPRVVRLGESISFNPRCERAEERSRIVGLLVSQIPDMLLEMTPESWAGIAVPR